MNFVTNVLKKYMQNEQQDVAVKEQHVPETPLKPSDKENEPFPAEKAETDKAEIGGTDSDRSKTKIRRSFLKAFDPLYTPSPEEISLPQKRPQIIIECSDASDSSDLSPLPADVSDDEAAFVDAAADPADDPSNKQIKPVQIDESLIKFYTPEKLVKSSENIPTSQVVHSDSVLEPAPTSEFGHQHVEKRKLHGTSRLEQKTHSPQSPVVVPCKKQRITETEIRDALYSKLEADAKKREEANVTGEDDTNSDISEIKTDSPDRSQKEQLSSSSENTYSVDETEKHAPTQFEDSDSYPELPETSDESLKGLAEGNTTASKSPEGIVSRSSSETYPELPDTSDDPSLEIPVNHIGASEAIYPSAGPYRRESPESESYPDLPETSDESSSNVIGNHINGLDNIVYPPIRPYRSLGVYFEHNPDPSDESAGEPLVNNIHPSETPDVSVDPEWGSNTDFENYPDLPLTFDESPRAPQINNTVPSETANASAKPGSHSSEICSELSEASDECSTDVLVNKTVVALPKTTEEELPSTSPKAELVPQVDRVEVQHSEPKVNEEAVEKSVEEEACQDHKEIIEEEKQESNNFLDEQSSPGTGQNTTYISEEPINVEDKPGSKSSEEQVEPVIESHKSLENGEPVEKVKGPVTPTQLKEVVLEGPSEKEDTRTAEENFNSASEEKAEKVEVHVEPVIEPHKSLEKGEPAEKVKGPVTPTQLKEVVPEGPSEKEDTCTAEENFNSASEEKAEKVEEQVEPVIEPHKSLEKGESAEKVKGPVTPTQLKEVVPEGPSEKEDTCTAEEDLNSASEEKAEEIEEQVEPVIEFHKSLEKGESAEKVKGPVTPTQLKEVVPEGPSEKEDTCTQEENLNSASEEKAEEVVHLPIKQEIPIHAEEDSTSVKDLSDQVEQDNTSSETCTPSEENEHFNFEVARNEGSYIESEPSSLGYLEEKHEEKVSENEEHVVESDRQETLDEAANKVEPEKGKEKTETSVASKVTFDIESFRIKMADLSEKLSELQQENSDLKLQLNASQQAKASLELEIRQKEEVIIKTQAEVMKNEQAYKQEIKQLREELKENTKLIEKDGSKELEEQLKEAKARETKAIAELSQRNKDDLNYQKIMEEYEKTIATRFADFQKLKEEHETATRHLANIELAFSDVHQKYERAKTIIEGFKSNEETLALGLQAAEKTCKQHEERYESLKSHAQAQIEKSNKEIILLRDKYEQDINTLKAIIKRLEIKCGSLEVSLQQKLEECAALSALCDEVTGKRM